MLSDALLHQVDDVMVHCQGLVSLKGFRIQFADPGKGNDQNTLGLSEPLESISESGNDGYELRVVVIKSLPHCHPPQGIQDRQVQLVDEVERIVTILDDKIFEQFYLLLDHLLHALFPESKISQGSESKPPLVYPGPALAQYYTWHSKLS